MNKDISRTLNGWSVVFRFVTPAFLGVLVWTVQDMKNDLRTMATTLALLATDYHHELGLMKDRLGKIEGRDAVLDGKGLAPGR